MSRNWNGRAALFAAGVALAASAPAAAQAEVAGGVIGCDASGNKQIAGALIGGVLGGVAGNNIIKKDQQAGTIVGATAGAAAGSYVGCQMQKKDASVPAPRVAAPPPPSRVRYEEAPDTYVVREPPPRVVYEAPPPRVVYESSPPRTVVVREPPPRVVYEAPPPRTVVVREHDDDDDYYEERRYKHRKGWVRNGYGMPPGHAKRYLIGERMPVTYVRQREYVIVEPARYRLRPAPVGYRWVRYDRDAYLVAAETGLISQVVRAVLE